MSFLSLPNLCQIWTDCIIEELPPSFLAGWWYSLAGAIFAMAMATIPLDWAWRDFCLCKISCLVRLYVCQSDLQWPTEEYPGSARTCPSQGFSFMRKYWFNLSWVCGQLVTQTVRPQDLLEIQPQIHCCSNTHPRTTVMEDFLKGRWPPTLLDALNLSLTHQAIPRVGHTRSQ